jgi:hypothetical protein
MPDTRESMSVMPRAFNDSIVDSVLSLVVSDVYVESPYSYCFCTDGCAMLRLTETF